MKYYKQIIGVLLMAAVAVLCVPVFQTEEVRQENERIQAENEAMRAETIAPYEGTDTILPNVYIGDMPVGGLTRQEAEEKLTADAEAEINTITVTLPDRTLTFSTEIPTLEEDMNTALDAAEAAGREDPDGLYDAVVAMESKDTVIEYDPEAVLDTENICDTIEAVAEEIYTAPVDDSVSIDAANLTMNITKGTSGVKLVAKQLENQILWGFEHEDYSDIVFDYTPIEPGHADVAQWFADYTWAPTDAWYDGSTQSVQPESVGLAPDLSVEDAQAAMDAAADGETVPLTFHTIDAEVTQAEVESMLFRDTLYSYGSVYASNANRTENLRLACAAINGTVIQPGEIFSFNDVVGQRTTAKGYKSATVYVAGKSEPQTGGGVCQVASTIYYCCLYAEMEIVERSPHMFKVTYVPYGMDATVYWGSLDYQFRNNTDYPLKINAYLSGGRCWIELVGTNTTNHTVKMESVAVTSLKYHVYRYVYDEYGTLIRTDDLGISTYKKHDS